LDLEGVVDVELIGGEESDGGVELAEGAVEVGEFAGGGEFAELEREPESEVEE
jgi:hypothetical protein